ncbi:MAG: methylated-DNA--[protein]-cysteine S-methyltransferase [Pseudomonadota bacterium]|nr:methylated-DNA--[protein]-cysteine S-methyltransferase [Pseudomonadota bacterium]
MASLDTFTGVVSYQIEEGCLTHLAWGNAYQGSPANLQVEQQLKNYFNGKTKTFNLPVKPKGTAFQQKVWQALRTIDYDTLVTYQDVAQMVNSHPRAVGGAIGKNPIPVVVPCHRVVGKNGTLTGFSGGEGMATKKLLIEHEQKHK